MSVKRLMALVAAFVLACAPLPAAAQTSRADVEVLVAYYAQYYGVPLELVRRVVNRESTFNPAARNGPYWGLMQILPATARTMGFRGQPSDLLDAETNLIYGVKYLRGAYLVAGGDHDRSVQLYARGYYYDAKAKGLLEQTGLRPGPSTPVAPTPPTQTVAAAQPAPTPEPLPEFAVASLAAAEPASVEPLGFLPPQRPRHLASPDSEALDAIAAAQMPSTGHLRGVRAAAEIDPEPSIEAAQTPVREDQGRDLRPGIDMIEGTFSMLAAMSASTDGL